MEPQVSVLLTSLKVFHLYLMIKQMMLRFTFVTLIITVFVLVTTISVKSRLVALEVSLHQLSSQLTHELNPNDLNNRKHV